MNTYGATSADLWAFEQISIKANDEQIDAMIRALQMQKKHREEAREILKEVCR